MGCSPWGCKESDTTERLSTHANILCLAPNLEDFLIFLFYNCILTSTIHLELVFKV